MRAKGCELPEKSSLQAPTDNAVHAQYAANVVNTTTGRYVSITWHARTDALLIH